LVVDPRFEDPTGETKRLQRGMLSPNGSELQTLRQYAKASEQKKYALWISN
jgi:hypothetical protein